MVGGVDRAAMLGDDAPHYGEPETAAAPFGRVVRHEKLVTVLGRNAGTVVADRNPDDAVRAIVLSRDLDDRRPAIGPRTRARPSERFDGVVHQVDHDPADLLRV